MTANNGAGALSGEKRRFAAKEQRLGLGIAFITVGGIIAIFNLSMVVGGVLSSETVSDAIFGLFFFGFFVLLGVGLVAVGLYFTRGAPPTPEELARRKAEVEERKAAEAARQAELKAAQLNQAATALAAASGAAALVAYRNLESTTRHLYPQDNGEYFQQVLDSIGFDRSTIASPRFGYLKALNGGEIEVFRDYVIHGNTAHDVDMTTRGQVYTDGAVQVSQRVVAGNGGQTRTVTDRHDLRTAHIQFTSTSWAIQVPINPDDVPAARQYVDQLAAHVETLKPQNVSAADIRDMVDSILNNSGQPPAEKLRQLSNLRYEHLLTDKEFLRAKERILGI